jgi:anti-sigma regulatory factor (Ser/Thr protein kinase)
LFSIEFPPEAVHVSTARIFSAAVARHFGADPADIEDLKIALTEACGSAISHVNDGSAEPVRLAAVPGGGMLTFEVNGHRRGELLRSDSPAAEPTTEEQMIALSAELIGALFPDAEFIDKPEGTFFRLSVPAGADG